MMHTDDEPLAQVREVYAWDHERLWRVIFAFTGERRVADDAVAEAFVLAARRGAGVRDLTGSIWRSAFTIARTELARERAEAILSDTEPLGSARGDSDDDRVATALDALAALTDADRQLFVWCHVGGWTAKEIAPNVGMRATTIRARLHRVTQRIPDLPTDRPTPFDRVRVPDQWDDILLRAAVDEPGEARSGRRRQRRWALVVGIVAVVALVGAFVVVTGAPDDAVTMSPTAPPTVTEPGDPSTHSALPSARIGGGRDVTLPISDVATGVTAGTFRLRLYETGGATFLEYEDIDVIADERVGFQVVELDGQLRSRTAHSPGSVGAIRMSDGTLTEPFRIRISLTDTSASVVQQSPLVLVTPDL